MLPRRLAAYLHELGQEAWHVSEIPGGVASTDEVIRAYADEQDLIVVTKDDDFRQSHLILGTPRRLLLLGIGNVANAQLRELMSHRMSEIETAMRESDFVELRAQVFIVHARRDDH